MKKDLRKLKLSRETLRSLQAETLGAAPGGVLTNECPNTDTCGCYPWETNMLCA